MSASNFGRIFAITLITQAPALALYFMFENTFLIDVPYRHPNIGLRTNDDFSILDLLPAASIRGPDGWGHAAHYAVSLTTLAWSFGAISVGIATAKSRQCPVPIISSIQVSTGRILHASLSLFLPLVLVLGLAVLCFSLLLMVAAGTGTFGIYGPTESNMIWVNRILAVFFVWIIIRFAIGRFAAVPSSVVEGNNFYDAIRRSTVLTQGHQLELCIVLLGTSLFYFIAVILCQVLFTAVQHPYLHNLGEAGEVLARVYIALISIALLGINLVIGASAYSHLRQLRAQ